ncbi:peroxiredoxin [Flavobacteriaceae bacterium TP-CH-4]|uniref:thioredoxin-dependent peroxiredoxin n=1 Tax=Pelagihabitans pacificus TaxID=2696054 RepID=A0A967AVV9_9FLAO|nr:peroxiredoxin [Pelagihabitans pacificus]NHF61364.1 peroxiredoxin [Pelagihabitans pacificus]
MGLKIGSSVPEFSLKDQHGNTFHSKDFIGKKAMVIYFYPKDNTPGCTKEACQFRDSYEDFTDLGAEVVGISSDSEKSHRSFAKKYELPFVLLADPDKKVRRLFKVENSLLVLPGRETYVVDKTGKIIMVFNSINASEHMRRALKALKSQSE